MRQSRAMILLLGCVMWGFFGAAAGLAAAAGTSDPLLALHVVATSWDNDGEVPSAPCYLKASGSRSTPRRGRIR
jgi:hypothetical protein